MGGQFILHFLYKEDAEQNQSLADHTFPGNKKWRNYKSTEKEVHIDMHCVQTFETLQTFLDAAYDDRMAKFHTGWRA